MFFGYYLFFVTYGAGLQKRLSAGLLCARMRRASGKSGRECIISPKLHSGREVTDDIKVLMGIFQNNLPSSPSQDGGSHKDGIMFGQNTFLLHRL